MVEHSGQGLNSSWPGRPASTPVPSRGCWQREAMSGGRRVPRGAWQYGGPRPVEHDNQRPDVSAPTTAEILALRKLERAPDQRWLEWAIELLVEGFDSRTLRLLAGETSPFQTFEIWAMTDRAIVELDLVPFAGKLEAAFALTSAQARLVLDGETTQEAGLSEITQLCIELDYPRALMDFYLLHHTLDDLGHDEVQWYWPGASRSNIQQLIEERCRSWLEEHGDNGPMAGSR